MHCREKSPLADNQKRKSDKKEKDDLAKSKDVQFLIQVSCLFLAYIQCPNSNNFSHRSKTIKNLKEKLMIFQLQPTPQTQL